MTWSGEQSGPTAAFWLGATAPVVAGPNVALVSAVIGNDSTGAFGDPTKPFATLGAAQAKAILAGASSATSPFYITVESGVYTEIGLGADGVNWQALGGPVTIQYGQVDGGATTKTFLFGDTVMGATAPTSNSAMTFSIIGDFTLRRTSDGGAVVGHEIPHGCICSTHPGTVITLDVTEISDTVSANILATAGGKFKRIFAGVMQWNGAISLKALRMTTANQVGIWYRGGSLNVTSLGSWTQVNASAPSWLGGNLIFTGTGTSGSTYLTSGRIKSVQAGNHFATISVGTIRSEGHSAGVYHSSAWPSDDTFSTLTISIDAQSWTAAMTAAVVGGGTNRDTLYITGGSFGILNGLVDTGASTDNYSVSIAVLQGTSAYVTVDVQNLLPGRNGATIFYPAAGFFNVTFKQYAQAEPIGVYGISALGYLANGSGAASTIVLRDLSFVGGQYNGTAYIEDAGLVVIQNCYFDCSAFNPDPLVAFSTSPMAIVSGGGGTPSTPCAWLIDSTLIGHPGIPFIGTDGLTTYTIKAYGSNTITHGVDSHIAWTGPGKVTVDGVVVYDGSA